VCLHLCLSRRKETPILSDLAWSLDVLGQSVPELTLFRQTHEVLPAMLIGAVPLSDSVYICIYRGCFSSRRNHARNGRFCALGIFDPQATKFV